MLIQEESLTEEDRRSAAIAEPIDWWEGDQSHLKDPTTGKLLERAVRLSPCKHLINEDTAKRILASTGLCPYENHEEEYPLIASYFPCDKTRYRVATLICRQNPEAAAIEANRLVDEGKQLLRNGKNGEASVFFFKALRLYPSDATEQHLRNCHHSVARELIESEFTRRTVKEEETAVYCKQLGEQCDAAYRFVPALKYYLLSAKLLEHFAPQSLEIAELYEKIARNYGVTGDPAKASKYGNLSRRIRQSLASSGS